MAYPNTDTTLLRLMPRVLRARDFHLYLENGKRLTDLWRCGGRAVLGHKPPKVLVELKNAAERGLFTPLPHPMEGRFLKALAQIFPGRTFRLYMDENSLRRALAEAGFENVPLWRPFLRDQGLGIRDWRIGNGDQGHCSLSEHDSPQSLTPSPLSVPVLPWPLGPAVLVLGKDMEDSFPPSELIPPVLLAPAARALHNLAAALKTFDPNDDWPKYPKIKKALAQTEGHWRRHGIYLTVDPDMDTMKYETLFRRFLEGGFLLPPSPHEPAILPLSMSAGEESKLAQLLVKQ